ncbi:MAG: hypothetical protein OXB93_06860 [Cytophagales bacterium]|nr:hypothetical protein [Cytophagales bacterium]
MQKIYIVVGERSGDMHAAQLIEALRRSSSSHLQFRGIGGHAMQELGVDLFSVHHELSAKGITETLRKLGVQNKKRKSCEKDILSYRPDLMLYVDFPGFNLPLAKFTHSLGIPNLYYIPPKTWLSRSYRLKSLNRYIQCILCIFPFEYEYFREHHPCVHYVGNPSVHHIKQHVWDKDWIQTQCQDSNLRVALLPGSRSDDVKVLKSLLPMISRRKDIRFYIPAIAGLEKSYALVQDMENVRVVYKRFYDILKISQAAIVGLGTASLEAALLDVPHMICHQFHWLTKALFPLLVHKSVVSLPNLILGKETIKEYIASKVNTFKVEKELNKLIENSSYRKNILTDFKSIRSLLGNKEAGKEVAHQVLDFLNSPKNV